MNNPNHVAFIMDGNGRWATERGLKRNEGHRAGTENIRNIIRHSKDLGIKHLTFYAFSTENFKRPMQEVRFLMTLIGEFFQSEIDELTLEGARIHIIGDISNFNFPVRKTLRSAEEMTKHNSDIFIHLALGYGSRDEIIQAVNAILKDDKKEITSEEFKQYLFTGDIPDPDLVIRTSGELRLSNFLLYQSAYSELYFTPVYWPDFTISEYDKALEEYHYRTRRFGGI